MFATAPKAKVGMRYETPNVSANATVVTVQNAIRAAEAGDTRTLFALYRDLTIGGTHIQAEFNKRKLAVLAQPHAILPADKTKPDDVTAALAVTTMIADADNWNDGLTHLLDSTLWPVTAAEKLFRARNLPTDMPTTVPLRFTLRKLEPVNPTLLCFQQPYAKRRGSMAEGRGQDAQALDAGLSTLDPWESDLRFFTTDAEGCIVYGFDKTYPVDPLRHIIHRGHLLAGIRDNWGGPMRSIVFWWLLSVLGRDWFARAMERFGVPFPVGRTNAKDKEAVDFLSEAFALSSKIGGLVVDSDTQIELKEVAISGLADAHEKFLGVCNREISKVIVGQTLSAEAQPTGLGSGTSALQGEVRNDIRMFDCIKLGETLQKQLFAPFLQINGLRGAAPKIVWGGLSDEDAQGFAALLNVLSQAGFEPTDEAIPTMNERLGFPIQRKVAATPPSPFGGFGGFGGGFGGAGAPARLSAEGDGRWVTISGSPVFIADGESLDDALQKKFGTPAKSRKKVTIQQTAAALQKKGIKLGPSETKPGGDGKWKTRYQIEHSNGKKETASIESLQHLAGFATEVPDGLVILSNQDLIAENLGVPAAWLNPLRDFLTQLEAKAADATLSDQDLMDFLDAAIARVPELFQSMNIDELSQVLEAGMGNAVIDSARRGLRAQVRPAALPAPAPAPQPINLSVANTTPRKKTVQFNRDAQGVITGATLLEADIVTITPTR